MKIDTIAVHGGQNTDDSTGAVPICQTTAFGFENLQHAIDLFDLKKEGHIYSRISNPTQDALEQRMAMLDNGIGALAVSSGQAAISLAIMNIAKSGDEVVSTAALYGGTYNLFSNTLPKYGITTHFIDSDNPDDFEKAINKNTKCIFAEVIGNPKLNIVDIEKLAQVAHRNNIPLIVDNTVATPYLFRPFDFGVDIAVYSATKYLGGHGTSLGGIIVDSGKFDWAASGKFLDFTEPDPSYHGIKYTEQFGQAAYIVKARVQLIRDFGPCLSPFNCFMLIQGIETLHLRMERHCQNALKVAEFLENNDLVSWVNYPGLKNHTYYDLAQKYMPKGQSSLVGFGIKGGKEAAIKFIEAVKLLKHVTNIGDVRTLVTYPAGTTHSQLSPEQMKLTGVTEDFIRLSVGIESSEDIINDINQALIVSNSHLQLV